MLHDGDDAGLTGRPFARQPFALPAADRLIPPMGPLETGQPVYLFETQRTTIAVAIVQRMLLQESFSADEPIAR